MSISGFVCFCGHCGNTGLLNYIASFDSVHETPKNEDIKILLFAILQETLKQQHGLFISVPYVEILF